MIVSFALALSGGGLLGAAHLGVWKALEEANLHPAAVAGTSAGGLVASLIALGVTPAAAIHAGDNITAHPLDYFHLNTWGLLHDIIPGLGTKATGLVDPAKFVEALLSLAPGATTTDDWKVPTILTAVDLTHEIAVAFARDAEKAPSLGRWLVTEHVSLKFAMLATMAMPGVFSAVPWKNRLLVDGGTADTEPLDWAYALHPGPLLSINVAPQVPLAADQMGIVEVFRRAEQYATDTLSRLRDRQTQAFVVTPDTLGTPFFGFSDYRHLVDIGHEAMSRALPAFRQYMAKSSST